ncbi:hypothetical protein DPMN_064459 [Dreissena polymorpha]|uniref:Uncharacterized protein n=1 Tax=Dreissena polymorpha TaxID=45954 RepID=A0A9D4CDI0_DREPO|nr:hypothetical protein DPMN_064459 [Dreissena polymorpha]
MGQPRWDPYGARLHSPSGSHVGSSYGTNIGAHMGPIWDPYRLFAGHMWPGKNCTILCKESADDQNKDIPIKQRRRQL